MNPLEVRELRSEFRIEGVWREAVAGVSFTLAARETLALVGESGCGKSVTAMSVMGLIRPPIGRVEPEDADLRIDRPHVGHFFVGRQRVGVAAVGRPRARLDLR